VKFPGTQRTEAGKAGNRNRGWYFNRGPMFKACFPNLMNALAGSLDPPGQSCEPLGWKNQPAAPAPGWNEPGLQPGFLAFSEPRGGGKRGPSKRWGRGYGAAPKTVRFFPPLGRGCPLEKRVFNADFVPPGGQRTGPPENPCRSPVPKQALRGGNRNPRAPSCPLGTWRASPLFLATLLPQPPSCPSPRQKKPAEETGRSPKTWREVFF